MTLIGSAMLVLALTAAPSSFASPINDVSSSQSPLMKTFVGIRRSDAGMAALEKRFWQVADPKSNQFRKFMTLNQLKPMLESTSDDVSNAQTWAVNLGCNQCELNGETKDSMVCLCPAKTDETFLQMSAATDSKVATTTTSIDFVYQASNKPVTNPFRRNPSSKLKYQPTANTGTPDRQKQSYNIPANLVATNSTNLQEVWGCGTFGVNKTELGMFYDQYCKQCNVSNVEYETSHHGQEFGDNFVEGTLDTSYITAFGVGVRTLNSNTNTSMATEEGEGQGIATVYAMEDIATRTKDIPMVLSLSLGSLGYDSCVALCDNLASTTKFTFAECNTYIQKQRQICLYASYEQQERINTAFKVMGLRGTTVLGASGDGGSHWSFGPFSEGTAIGKALNVVGCKRQSPLFPANSP